MFNSGFVFIIDLCILLVLCASVYKVVETRADIRERLKRSEPNAKAYENFKRELSQRWSLVPLGLIIVIFPLTILDAQTFIATYSLKTFLVVVFIAVGAALTFRFYLGRERSS